MLPAEAPAVTIYAGDAATLVVYQLLEADGTTPRDLTSYTAWESQWRRNHDATSSITLEVETDQLAIGKVIVTASGTATQAMTGNGVWDVQAIGPDGEPRTFARGTTSLLKDVTR